MIGAGTLPVNVMITGTYAAGTAFAQTKAQGQGLMQSLGMKGLVVGGAMTAMGMAISRATDGAISAFAGFDQAMANTRSIAQGTNEDFERMREQAMEMSREMPQSAQQIAEGYYFLASAGLDANEIMDATPGILRLATASATSFDQTAQLVTSTVRAMGYEFSKTNRVGDVLQGIVKGSQTTLAELATTLPYVAASARNLGIPIEELGASIMILRNNGIDASMAGTGLRMTLIRLADTNVQAKMAELGATVIANADGTMNFEATMRSLNEALSNLSPIEQQAALTELFGARAANAASVLLRSIDTLADYQTELEKTGQVTEAFDKQMEGTANQLKLLQNRAENATIALGEALIPAEIAATKMTLAFKEAIAGLPKPLLEAFGGTFLLTGQMMSMVGPGLMAVSSLSMLASSGINMKGAMVTGAIGMGIMVGAIGALTAESMEMRIAFGLLTGALVAVKVAAWAASAANIGFWGTLTLGVGVAAGVTAALVGVSMLMDKQREVTTELGDEYKTLQSDADQLGKMLQDTLGTNMTDLGDIMGGLEYSMEGLEQSWDDAGLGIQDTTSGMEEAMNMMTTAMEEAAVTAEIAGYDTGMGYGTGLKDGMTAAAMIPRLTAEQKGMLNEMAMGTEGSLEERQAAMQAQMQRWSGEALGQAVSGELWRMGAGASLEDIIATLMPHIEKEFGWTPRVGAQSKFDEYNYASHNVEQRVQEYEDSLGWKYQRYPEAYEGIVDMLRTAWKEIELAKDHHHRSYLTIGNIEIYVGEGAGGVGAAHAFIDELERLGGT